MRGLMQDWPLLCHRIIEHAASIHGTRKSSPDQSKDPSIAPNYAEIRDRALKVSQRLDRDGIKLGDRVATIAWNTWRHLEAWYGIMGIGAICHTVNPRLFPDQIAWIINHAGRPRGDGRYHLVPDAGKNRRQTEKRGTLHHIHRQGAHAADHVEKTRSPMRTGSRKPTAISSGRPSTKIPRPRCATLRAPPATQRACCIRTAPT